MRCTYVYYKAFSWYWCRRNEGNHEATKERVLQAKFRCFLRNNIHWFAVVLILNGSLVTAAREKCERRHVRGGHLIQQRQLRLSDTKPRLTRDICICNWRSLLAIGVSQLARDVFLFSLILKQLLPVNIPSTLCVNGVKGLYRRMITRLMYLRSACQNAVTND